RPGCGLVAISARSLGWKARPSKRGCRRPGSVSESARSTTSLPIIELLVLEPGERAHHLLRQVPRTPHARELRSRSQHRKADVKMLAARRGGSEAFLSPAPHA